ncbi:hypothetical protein [Povalibacter sp.]
MKIHLLATAYAAAPLATGMSTHGVEPGELPWDRLSVSIQAL